MSVHSGGDRPVTAASLRARKGATPIVALTAYAAPTAAIADRHCDVLLVGDSLGMVVHGYPSTLPVSLELMILHGQAVVRGAAHALVVVDLPFGAYEASPEQAFTSAARVMAETGCGAVKLEGGARMAEAIAFLVARGIPVMGHIGLTPQSVHTLGGFKTQGRDRAQWAAIEADAVAVADAGAFAVVIEGVVEPLAARITANVAIPTIGIGASAACDGQILVLEDMAGLTPRTPKFVKRYAELGTALDEAVRAYAADVRARRFPGEAQLYRAEP